jgi:hypothetical protein
MISNGASAYLDAAAKLLENDPLTGSHPYWFTVFQSIELSLKSFLRAKGLSQKEIKVLNHSIAMILDKANGNGFANLIELTPDEDLVLRETGELYYAKVFQYSEYGMKSVPYAEFGILLAKKIFEAIRPIAIANRTFHHGKNTAIKPKG